MNTCRRSASLLPGLGLVLLGALTAGAPVHADDVRINQLMLDIQDLQRTVRDQARRIDELERALASFRQSGARASSATGREPLEPPDDEWLKAGNWERVKLGMRAQEVIAILGIPASMRNDPSSNVRTLFYAKQIGASGFLGGTIVFENDRVREISRPVLK